MAEMARSLNVITRQLSPSSGRNVRLGVVAVLNEGVALEDGQAEQVAVGGEHLDNVVAADAMRVQVAGEDSGSKQAPCVRDPLTKAKWCPVVIDHTTEGTYSTTTRL